MISSVRPAASDVLLNEDKRGWRGDAADREVKV